MIDVELRADLARVRYLALASVVAHARRPAGRVGARRPASFDVVLIDPLSSVASTLGLDFDRSNGDYVAVYDRLVQPLVTAGLLVVLLENIGHAIEAKNRAKGASAKSDRADLTFSCKLVTRPVPAMILTAQKVAAFAQGFSVTHRGSSTTRPCVPSGTRRADRARLPPDGPHGAREPRD